MSPFTNDEFANRVLDFAGSAKFEGPAAYYDRDGDCIEFLASDDEFYSERVDDLVTVYYSHESGEIIGSLIKGVSCFMTKHPKLRIVVRDGRVRLSHLFLAGLVSHSESGDEPKTIVYQKLFEQAEKAGVEAEMACA
jgi:hypothetical protein